MAYWQHLLENKGKNEEQKAAIEKLQKDIEDEVKGMNKLKTQYEIIDEINKEKNTSDKIKKQDAAVIRIASLELMTEIESRLARFVPLVEGNPRLMKRVVNAYAIFLGMEIQKGKNLDDPDLDLDKLALMTILNLRWPKLSEFLKKYPNMINYFYTTNSIPNDIPDDIKAMFSDHKVINVIRGKAEGIKTSLNENALTRLNY